MSYFAPRISGSPLRCVLVGAGGMGRKWARVLQASSDVECVAVVDFNLAAAESAIEEAGLKDCRTAVSLTELEDLDIEMVVNATIPEAHRQVTLEAFSRGIPVLSEKPIAPTVADGMALVAAAEAYGTFLMVSQSRRYFDAVTAIKRGLPKIGELGIISHQFFKAPRFGGFREKMEHVLLVDMAIHPFDLARFLVGSTPTAVYCEDFNPSWSWYEGAAAAHAVFEFSSGVRFGYTGSWCSPGNETSWNGEWRISGSEGTIEWDGEDLPRMTVGADEPEVLTPSNSEPLEIAGALGEFVEALKTGSVPFGEAHRNLLSLAMVEAAITSSERRSSVDMGEILQDALVQARQRERDEKVSSVLNSWASPWAAAWE